MAELTDQDAVSVFAVGFNAMLHLNEGIVVYNKHLDNTYMISKQDVGYGIQIIISYAEEYGFDSSHHGQMVWLHDEPVRNA